MNTNEQNEQNEQSEQNKKNEQKEHSEENKQTISEECEQCINDKDKLDLFIKMCVANRNALKKYEDKTAGFLAWNAAIFVYALAITDVKSIIDIFKFNNNNLIISVITILSTLLICGIVVGLISLFLFVSNLNVKYINDFSISNYWYGEIEYKKICDDYKIIIKEYDDKIEAVAKRFQQGMNFMIVSSIIIIVVEYLLKLVMCLK